MSNTVNDESYKNKYWDIESEGGVRRYKHKIQILEKYLASLTK